jgi:ubiquinone/menaquinone biosynthesis C-methylase UbiE
MVLARQLEPELMDTDEDATTYDQMDHQTVNRAFLDDLLQFAKPEGEVLDMGTGTARIPIELCRRCESVRVVAADLATAMLDVARINIEIANLTGRILLVHSDSKQSDFVSGRFELVISNSLVHHISEPMKVLREAVRVTAPRGRLFVRDLMRPETDVELDRFVELYAGNESSHAKQLFRDSLHAALNLGEIRQLVEELGFSPQTVQATSDRHWTWAAQLSNRINA